MERKFEFVVEQGEEAQRLDKFLADKFLTVMPEITRSKIQQLIDDKLVIEASSSRLLSNSQKTKIGQKISVLLPPPPPSHLTPKQIPFDIVFEDEDLMVVNKPAGLTVHPGSGNRDNTLVNALLFSHQGRLSGLNGEFRPGIVHRLDKDTSGLMIVAKNDLSHQRLTNMLKERDIKRSYLAFIYGVMVHPRGTINKDIARAKNNRLKMAIVRTEGRNAITHYETKQIFLDGFVSLVECRLETGRTHQIRVHFESEKHSLIGDQLYSSCKRSAPKNLNLALIDYIDKFPRQALHSYKISFSHPINHQEISLQIGLTQDLKELHQHLLQK